MLFGKDAKRSQPHPGWPWGLSEGGVLRQNPTWEDIERGLRALSPEPNSFIILEQRDPKNKKNLWFIQSAIAKMGPHKGQYAVEVGWNGRFSPKLVERMCAGDALKEVLAIFERAYQYGPLDLTGFEKMEL